MDKETTWQVIRRERAALADILETLTPEEWEHPSLCEGWSVRDVAAHVAAWPDTTVSQGLAAALRARGNFNRTIHDEAQRRSRRPTSAIVADLRRLSASRHRPPVVTYREGLLDVLVHTQDIVIPLGRRHDMPIEAARDSTERAWGVGFPLFGFPFFAKRRLSGYRLEATDIDWSVGEGPALRGPMSALLLLVTGRPAALSWLSGEGLPKLSRSLAA